MLPTASQPEKFIHCLEDARDMLKQHPEFEIPLRRVSLLPPSRRARAASHLARELKKQAAPAEIVRLAEALALQPHRAADVINALPFAQIAPNQRRRVWPYFALSLLLHPVLIALLILLWIWNAAHKSTPPPARSDQIRVTLSTPPPLPPPIETPRPTPFLDTAGLPQLDQPDPRAAFEGETNTAAMSRSTGPGNPSLPNQQGDPRPGIELFNADYSPENARQPSAPTPEHRQPTAEQPTPEKPEPSASRPNSPLQDKLRNAPNARLQTGEKNEAQKIREQETRTNPARPTDPSESTNPPAAFSAFKRQNRIEGGATRGETDSAAARESDLGRYKAKLYRAIGSRWYAYVRQDDGKIGIGVVRLRFYVRHDGVILPPEIIQGAEHAALLAVSRRSIMEVSGQLEPFPPSMRQQLGDGYYEEVSFTIY